MSIQASPLQPAT
ncbi:hypothetical protein LEMLEM_LOCUS21974 [Lemmus lemmus]